MRPLKLALVLQLLLVFVSGSFVGALGFRFYSRRTAVAAEQLGRHWLGIELNPDFAALAETRIAEAQTPGDTTNRWAA